VSYFDRVVAPNEYHFSLVADADDHDEIQRPEDIIEATDSQLEVWREIASIAQRIRANKTESYNSSDSNSEGDRLKKQLLKLWILVICQKNRRSAVSVAFVKLLCYA
jgi:hypothetical protein